MGVPNVPPMRSDTHPIPPVSSRSRHCGDGSNEGGEKRARNDSGHFTLEGEKPGWTLSTLREGYRFLRIGRIG